MSGRCSEATKVGPPAGPAGRGGRGYRCVSQGLHRAGAGGRLPRTWGALPAPLGDSLPASSVPRLGPRKLGAPRGFLVTRWGDARQ